MLGTSLTPKHDSWLAVCQSYVQLTKPRIIPLLLITTAAAMWLAGNGQVDPQLVLLTLLGGTLAAASAQTLNCIYDQDIDYEMVRTRKRPIPSGRVQPRHALVFAIVLGLLSFLVLAIGVNLLSALLAMSGIGFYMVIYTHWLKRTTAQNIVIGGAAGSIPPLVGWAAVTGDLSWTAWLLFAIIFLWTPPHFWALALMIRDDYAQVNIPMLPVVAGDEATVKQIWLYTLLLIPASFMLVYPCGAMGWVYGGFAAVLGTVFLQKTWQLAQEPGDRVLAKGTFKYSILYMMLLSTGMVIDSLPMTHHVIASLGQVWQMAMAGLG
ncbi:MAG: protoheme IX farnesyltransferase [Spirulina sp. SIO3F2]|nr:protoheme IX farnesyltransferase [Spirulina sp. SIO3F2]